MRFLTLCLFCCGLIVAAMPVQAAFMTGKSLLALCSSTDKDNLFACENYIAGVVDYHKLVRSLGTAPSVDFCLPNDIKMQSISRIVTVYLAQHPEQHNFVAAPAVSLAIYNQYPCPKGRKK
jgi:hypothetical protein